MSHAYLFQSFLEYISILLVVRSHPTSKECGISRSLFLSFSTRLFDDFGKLSLPELQPVLDMCWHVVHFHLLLNGSLLAIVYLNGLACLHPWSTFTIWLARYRGLP